MKKQIIRSLLAIMISGVIILPGCSSSTASSESSAAASSTIQYADSDFIADLEEALQARWNISDTADENYESGKITSEDALYDEYQKAVDTEYDMVSKYLNERFRDSKLQELAVSYINALKDQKDTAKTRLTNTDAEKTWSDAYNTRAKILQQLVNDYGVKVRDEYQDNLNELLADGSSVQKSEDEKEAIEKLLKDFHFEQTADEYGFKTYTATVQNSSGYDFDEFDVNINLLDSDGTLVETQYAYVSNWKNGQSAKFEFETDTEFSSTEVSVSSWTDSDGNSNFDS